MCVLMYVLPTNLTFLFGVTGNGAAAVILITIASRKTERQESKELVTSVPTTSPSGQPS
jgi:hypothetical protein